MTPSIRLCSNRTRCERWGACTASLEFTCIRASYFTFIFPTSDLIRVERPETITLSKRAAKKEVIIHDSPDLSLVFSPASTCLM
jgi:hypothetical protein